MGKTRERSRRRSSRDEVIVFGSRELGAGGGGGYAGGRTASWVVRLRIGRANCWGDGRLLARRPVNIREDMVLLYGLCALDLVEV